VSLHPASLSSLGASEPSQVGLIVTGWAGDSAKIVQLLGRWAVEQRLNLQLMRIIYWDLKVD
jgi:hypothetical protein